jgi:hypothetical protein
MIIINYHTASYICIIDKRLFYRYIELDDTMFYDYSFCWITKDEVKCQQMLYDVYAYQRMIETNGRLLFNLIISFVIFFKREYKTYSRLLNC